LLFEEISSMTRLERAVSLFLIAVATICVGSQARSITIPGARQHVSLADHKATDQSQVVRAVIALLADRGLFASDVRLEFLPGQAGGSVVRVGRPKSQFFFYDGPKDYVLGRIRAETQWIGSVTLDTRQQIHKVRLPNRHGTLSPGDAALDEATRMACNQWFSIPDPNSFYEINARRGQDERVTDSAYGVSIDAMDLRYGYHMMVFVSKTMQVVGGIRGNAPKKIRPAGQLR
jgi:hypothetical protein